VKLEAHLGSGGLFPGKYTATFSLVLLPKRHIGELRMFTVLPNLLKKEDGATAIEYGLIAALIAVVIVTALTAVGGSLTSVFTTVASDL
jgi:pilus assembly protein Flp/PilA